MDDSELQMLRNERLGYSKSSYRPKAKYLAPRKRVPWLNKLIATIFIAAGIFIAICVFHFFPTTVNETELPIVAETNDETTIKVRPQESENRAIANSDKMIYSEFEEKPKAHTVEQLLPAPEEPIQIHQTEETKETPVPPEPLQPQTKEVNATPAPPADEKSRKNIYAALEETQRAIHNQASSLVADNLREGKSMPRIIDNPNANLKIVSSKQKEPIEKSKSNEAPAKKQPEAQAKSPAVVKNCWVQFAPVSSSQDAERAWHRLVTHKTAKTILTGAQHKVQRVKATQGGFMFSLLAGPFGEESAAACCKKLKQAHFSCKVIKK